MDIETGLELGKFPLMSQGEADLPSPNAYKAAVIRASAPGFDPEDDDKYLEKIPEWTVKEMAVALVASGSGESILCDLDYCMCTSMRKIA